MKEELLHFIWKFKYLADQNLETLSKESITILHPGTENLQDGPDFFNARIKIGNEEWVGNVEIHVNASDWNKHGHTPNKKYSNLILHVVYNQDVEIDVLTFQKIPTLELKGILPKQLLVNYTELLNNSDWVPCAAKINTVDDFQINTWLNRLLVERIEGRTLYIEQLFEKYQYDWNSTFLEVLFKGFGFKQNAHAFSMLAQCIGYSILKKEKDEGRENLEALLLGSAGFLPESSNHFYIQSLVKLFSFQKTKYSIEPITKSEWTFGGVRPPNQPVVRIIQLVRFLYFIPFPLTDLIGENFLKEIQSGLNHKGENYWKSHGNIETPNKSGVPKMGSSSIDGIIINSLLPFQFFYAKWTKSLSLMDNALDSFALIKAEKNGIVEKWKSLGLSAENAGRTQALLELKNNYCSQKKCLFCAIGNQVVKP